MKADKLFIGGGYIRATIAGERVSDFDLFGSDKAQIENSAYRLCAERKAKLHKTDNAITLLSPPRTPVQFITKWVFAEPEKLIESFDFTVCQAVIWFNGDNLDNLVSDSFYADLAAKRLVYTSPVREEAAGGSLMRVIKYLGRGYNIHPGSLGAVIAQLMQHVHTHENNQGLTSDKITLAKIITGLLREVDPLLIVDGVECIDAVVEHA